MNVNVVILAGNLTRDPQLSYLPSQTAVVETGMAINKKFKGQDGQMKETVCFIDLKFFGKTAEAINKYCKKGDPLFVRGELTLDQWTAQDGTKKSKHRVTVESFQFINTGNPQTAGTKVNDEPQAGGDDLPF
jgi:single-strand DNA-binding protein